MPTQKKHWDLFFRIADHFDFAYVAEPLNHFRQHRRTIRSATKGRVTYDEFFRVLLSRVGHTGFSAAERKRFRLHVIYLWAVELLRPGRWLWHVGIITGGAQRSCVHCRRLADGGIDGARRLYAGRPASGPFERARLAKVSDQIASRGVRDPRVLDAMRAVPRHEFVPIALRDDAYFDSPLPIGHGQTISQPTSWR